MQCPCNTHSFRDIHTQTVLGNYPAEKDVLLIGLNKLCKRSTNYGLLIYDRILCGGPDVCHNS